ncbi:MAG: non-heme iron oxygenase ferredoxin subunit [Dehalococcoidia bacterium]|nr:non-heme iron oxygenase ferredoxin subunit [Dehalococcoidia bacterium]
MAEGFVKVAETRDVSPGEMKLVELEGQRIVIANVAGSFYAFGDVCTHANGPLSDGVLQEDRVECPWHGSAFDVKSGRPLSPPARSPIPTYRLKVENGGILVAVLKE